MVMQRAGARRLPVRLPDFGTCALLTIGKSTANLTDAAAKRQEPGGGPGFALKQAMATPLLAWFGLVVMMGGTPPPPSHHLLDGVTFLPTVTVGPVDRAINFDDQIQQPAPPAPTPRHTGIKATLTGLVTDVKHLPSRQNLFITLIGAGAALAIHPLDDNIHQHFASSESGDAFFKPGKYQSASPTRCSRRRSRSTQSGASMTSRKFRISGWDLLRSIVISEGITQTLKYLTQRERPDGSDSHSFPSGHAADTFAVGRPRSSAI